MLKPGSVDRSGIIFYTADEKHRGLARCHRNSATLWVIAVLAGALAACGSSSNTASDGDSIYLDVLPPGNNGNSAGGKGLPIAGFPTTYPANYVDQAQLYGDISYARPNLQASPCTPPVDIDAHQKASDLACNYYKHEGLTPDKVVSTETLTAPSKGKVTIQRDGWGVPFVTAANRQDLMYGFGWAQAEDRLWLLDVLRHVGRGELTEFLGPAPEFEQIDSGLAITAGYSDQELDDMVSNTLSKFGYPDPASLGSLMATDIDASLQGINDYVASVQNGPNQDKKPPEYAVLAQTNFKNIQPFTRNDIVASAIFIQSLFAVGGGAENTNELMLQQMDASITAGIATLPQQACEMWRDIRHADDPDATRTTSQSFAQSPASLDESCPQTLPAGAAIWDNGSYQTFNNFTLVDATAGTQSARTTSASPGQVRRLARAQNRIGASAVQRLALSDRTVVSHTAAHKPLAALDRLGPFERLRHALRAAGFQLPNSMSNWLAVTAAESRSGHPIGVMGPQTSYYGPELLWEVALHSTGGTPLDFNGRGMVFGGLPYLLIGRGTNYAWSATSGDSDLVDTRVSLMCNTDGSPPSLSAGNGDGFPDADGYLFDAGDGNGAQCRKFYERTDTWTAKPTLASIGSSGPLATKTATRLIMRTHYGPVFAFASYQGHPVAISSQRTTFNAELDTAAPFALTGTPMITGAQQFQHLFNGVTGTFNWLYIDRKDVAYVQSGLLPERDPGQSPDLPVWGNGLYEWASDRNLPANYFQSYGGSTPYPARVTVVPQDGGALAGGWYEWQNFLPFASHPQDLNPQKGYLLSWNNSPAKGWWAADNRPNWGPVHRVDAEEPRFEAWTATGKKFDFANMIEIAADAGYTDLRAQEILPLLLQLMQQGQLSSDQQQVVSLMQDWLNDGDGSLINGQPGFGAWRRDRDGDGQYDHRAAVVLMDAWYQHLMTTVTSQLIALDPDDDVPGLTNCVGVILLCRYDAPRQQGSAYEYGWYQPMFRMLQMALNTPGHSNYRALRCAGSNAAGACRTAVLNALDAAIGDLGGIANEARWDGKTLSNEAGKKKATVEDYDEIEFALFGALSDPPMPWINRPTFQQVIEIH